MAKGKAIAIGVGLLLLMSGKKADAKLPEPGKQPDEEPKPGEDPTPGEEPTDPAIQVIFVPGEEPEHPAPDIEPIFPGPDQPLPPPPTVTPIAVFNDLVKPTPQVNAGYFVKTGDTLLGPNGIAAQAIKAATGQTPTGSERFAYYQAITRVRSNWMLYASQAVNNPVEVTDETGATVAGSVTAAFYKMHDSWPSSMTDNDMPNRLIGFSRNQNLQPIPLGDWKSLAHGIAKTTRQYGCLWLPDLACVDFGPDVFTNALCDWPPSLWEALGLGRMEWTAA